MKKDELVRELVTLFWNTPQGEDSEDDDDLRIVLREAITRTRKATLLEYAARIETNNPRRRWAEAVARDCRRMAEEIK